VADCAQGSRIVSMPAQPRQRPHGHLRQRESESAAMSRTQTYDRTQGTCEKHLPQARPAAADLSRAPLDGLAAFAEKTLTTPGSARPIRRVTLGECPIRSGHPLNRT
jgi:hypothetical protein